MQIHTFKSVKAPQLRDIKKKKKRQSKKKISEYLENYISDNENAIMRRVLNKIRILRVLENKGEIVQHRVRHKVSLPPWRGEGGGGGIEESQLYTRRWRNLHKTACRERRICQR